LLKRENCPPTELIVLNLFLKYAHQVGIASKVPLVFAAPVVAEKLDRESAEVRNAAFLLLRMLMQVLSKHSMLSVLVQRLAAAPEASWHQKEELLLLLCYLFIYLELAPEEWYYKAFEKLISSEEGLANPINFKNVILAIASHLDDKVPKVRKAALECLAIISDGANNGQGAVHFLHEQMHWEVYDRLVEKLQKGEVYYINT